MRIIIPTAQRFSRGRDFGVNDRLHNNVRLGGVGDSILDAPYDGTACKWGVKDAALYVLFPKL